MNSSVFCTSIQDGGWRHFALLSSVFFFQTSCIHCGHYGDSWNNEPVKHSNLVGHCHKTSPSFSIGWNTSYSIDFIPTILSLIRDFPDHATFREKGVKVACADKLGVVLSLTLCNKANFEPLQRVKYDGLEKM